MMYIFDPSSCDEFTRDLYFDWARREGINLLKPVQAEQSVTSERLLIVVIKGRTALVEKRFFNLCPPPDRPLEYYL